MQGPEFIPWYPQNNNNCNNFLEKENNPFPIGVACAPTETQVFPGSDSYLKQQYLLD